VNSNVILPNPQLFLCTSWTFRCDYGRPSDTPGLSSLNIVSICSFPRLVIPLQNQHLLYLLYSHINSSFMSLQSALCCLVLQDITEFHARWLCGHAHSWSPSYRTSLSFSLSTFVKLPVHSYVPLFSKVGIRNLGSHLRNSAILRTTKLIADLRTKKSCGTAIADLHNLTSAIPQLSAVSFQFRYFLVPFPQHRMVIKINQK
jgi:hypothetical protein